MAPVAGLGPTLGFFAVFSPEKVPLAVDRFTAEADHPYLAGKE